MNIFAKFMIPGAVLLLAAVNTSFAAEPVDTVAFNGKIYTMNEQQPWAEAIAIRGADIAYVGDNEGAKKLIGKNTTVGDLKGKMMLPGLIDTHSHLLPTMFFASGLLMENKGDMKWMLEQVCQYVKDNPDGPYYSFGGAFEGSVPITRQMIDECIADKPFIMIGQGGHGGWANTKALEFIDIVPGKPDPVDYWTRDEKDMPTGEVGTSPAIWWMVSKLDLIQKESILRSALPMLKGHAKRGITTSFEAATFEGTGAGVWEAVSELEKSGDLTLRIIAGAMIQRDYNVEGALAELKKWGPVYSSDMFNVNFMKIHGDGSPDNYTSKMLLPYKDDSKNAGFVALPPEQMKEVLLQVAEWGYDIHTHTTGDGAVRWALDAFEAVRKAGYDDIRINTGHTMFVDPTDIPRFKKLNIGVDSIVAQAYAIPSTMAVLTEEQKKRYMLVKSFIDAGVRVGFSADHPVFPADPFVNMYVAMTRNYPGKDLVATPTLNEAVDLETALRCYTTNSAYMVHMEDKIGSIEVGKKADLIVIDRNIFEIPVDELPEVNVLATMVDGRVVHEESVDWEPPQEWWRGIDIHHIHGNTQ